ncbi:MAG: MCE family protein [Flavobacterium sp.]|nr:MAG: MCE family protein [Flavobacterium sp.]
MRVSREIKTAVLVIASILLFIWGYSFLKGRDLLANYKTFYAQYDNVEGLAASAPVTINGLVVGKVSAITLENKTGKLLVEIQVKTDFPISKTSKINIYEPGLIGGKQIQIVPDLNNPTLAESGDRLSGGVVPGLTALVGEKLTPLQEKVEKMVVSADVVLRNINTIFDANTKNNLKSAIANLNQTMAGFRDASGSLSEILNNNKSKLDRTFTNLDKVSSNFSKVSDTLANAEIGKTLKTLETALGKVDQIMTQIQSGKGTLGKLINDEQLYRNLDHTSKELELLLQDIRLNPTRYVNISVFGKKNKPYVAPKPNDTLIKTP